LRDNRISNLPGNMLALREALPQLGFPAGIPSA